jgi:DeoR family transcriptional regulator, fructose operon transcriptional repressor
VATFRLSCSSLPEAEVRRAMINAAREVVLLVEHTVFDIEANEHVADLKKIHTGITDSGTLAAQRLELYQSGVNVIVAGPTPDAEVQPQATVHQ